MDNAYQCLLATDFTKDGIKIEGHEYIAEVALTDLDTERVYFYDRCERCGNISTSFSSNWTKQVDYYPVHQTVGGQPH